jgi:hypothetical protein
MKIDRLEAHDRYQHFTRQSFDIGQTCQNVIDQRPFGNVPFYIFAHKREIGLDERLSIFTQDFFLPDDQRQFKTMADVPTTRLIWQPRLTKPEAQTNSMLFRAHPPSDVVKVIWMIPDPELWDQYKKGNVTQNQTVVESIYNFQNHKSKLEAPEPGDLSEKKIDSIYREISRSTRRKKGPIKIHSS